MDSIKHSTLTFVLRLAAVAILFVVSLAGAEEPADTAKQPEQPTEEGQQAAPTTPEEPTSTPAVDEAFVVKKITFKGVQTLHEEMLLTLIQTQVGHEISGELLTKDIGSLYKDTGFFSDIAVEPLPAEGGGFEVVYHLVERPKIEGISITGNEKLDIGNLMKLVTLNPTEIYSERHRWQSERAIRKLYHEKGYYLAGIQVHLDKNAEENSVQVTFEIDEGPRVRIKEINFIGNERVSAKKLRKQMKTRIGKHFDEMLFEEEDLGLNLRNYYQDRGFALVKILGHTKSFNADKTELMLDITVDEGPEFVVGTYTLNIQAGAKTVFSEKKIRRMVDPAEGEIFNRAIFDESIQKLQQAYLDKGYLLSSVAPIPDFDEADGLVNITLNIDEGDVIVINNVRITGLEKTKENIVRRELDWLDIKPDELLDVKALRKARQRLFQMGSFIRAVDFVPSDTENDNSKDLVVNIAETPRTGMVQLGGGYGSEGGIFGSAEVGQNNLFGRAYRVHVKGELGTRDHHTAQISFGTPWILGTPTRLNAQIYDNRRFRSYYGTVGAILNNEDVGRYVWGRRGASLTLGRPIAYDIDLSVRLRNERVNVEKPDQDADPINRSTRSILFAVGRDTRDYRTSLFDPTAGSFNTLSYEYSGGILGADNHFQKYTADSSWFVSPWWNHVIAVHARAGYMRSRRADYQDFFYERFYLGGVDTIRGYENFEIYPDPDENGKYNPYGGDKVFFSNLEYRIPVSPQLTAALFFDMGQVWDESVSNVFNQINLKRGVGAEVRFNMLGMLARLGWGYGLDRASGQASGKFHFTIGPGF